MKKGCLIGCFGAIGVVILLIVVGFFAIDAMFNLFRPVPRVDLAERYGDDLAIVAKFDPEAAVFKDMAGEALRTSPGMIDWFVPYEAGLFMHADPEEARRWFDAAVSTRRLGGFFSYMQPVTDPGEMGGGFVGGSVTVGSDGVISMSADGDISQETLVERDRRWPEPSDKKVSLEGGHFVEIIVNNANGEAYLALERGAMEAIEDAQAQANEGAEPPVFDKENLSTLFYQMQTTRITFDFAARDEMEINVTMECPDEVAAGSVMVSSNVMLDRLRENLAKDDVELEGELDQDGNRVNGTLYLRGYDEPVVDAAQEAVDDFREGPPPEPAQPAPEPAESPQPSEEGATP